jgi:hypothetical protein
MCRFASGRQSPTWVDANGYRAVGDGYAREVYLDCPPGDRWVTELQVEVSLPADPLPEER